MTITLPTQASKPVTDFGKLTILNYSAPKFGKSTWASKFPEAIFFECEPGLNHLEAEAVGSLPVPKELPAQALDHASGYLMAFGAMMAKARQAREGGSWHVQVSLAQTGRWIAGLGRLENGFAAPDPTLAEVDDLLEDTPSKFGALRAVRHAAVLSATPAKWDRPAVPLGTDEATWAS